ncbi:MAG: aspartate aminotransferase family protein [Anaerolineae bacterium]|jgi:sphinganine-1-phosphate aldolase|nr:aspartate aminotransferase family protein [Anaerolineae bacterium]MBT7072576.1 aspartate aminotransferase family protein [Anaerolineae bacterium]MBT7324598.1 aspartate aminotransferase family protein [Anaerolineae bacterium]
MLSFPSKKRSKEDVLATMRAARDHDVQWQQGKAFGLIYHIDEAVDALLQEAFTMFFAENGLNPTAFPSLKKFETEVVAMTASLLGGDAQVSGNMTSGGTESLLCAVVTAREWARAKRPEITAPEIVLARSAHPAFEKAAHYFGLRAVHVPVRDDLRADVSAMIRAVTPNTILMVGSAPAYPHGVIDPIRELAAAAQELGILFHVDSCVGGFMLPFVRKLGYPVPDFDFSVPGVTSMSADVHKYGYAAKGASVILYKTPELRRHQMFVSTDWSGGIYPSPTLAGTRPAGPIAAAWAVLNYLGEEGYLEITDAVMKTVIKMREGVNAIPGLKTLSDPEMSIFAIASDEFDIYEVADELGKYGWHLDRQHFPQSLHVTVNYAHVAVADDFLCDLAESAAIVRAPSLRKGITKWVIKLANALTRILPEHWVSAAMGKVSGLLGGSGGGLPERMAPMYGLIGSLPNRGDLKELVLDLLDSMTRYSKE